MVAQGSGEQHGGGPALSSPTEAVMSCRIACSMSHGVPEDQTSVTVQLRARAGRGQCAELSLVHFPLRDRQGRIGFIHMHTQGRIPSVAFLASNTLSLFLSYLPTTATTSQGLM